MHRLGVDQVVVVQDQQHLAVAGLGGQLVDQRRHQPLEGCRRRRAQQRADPLPDPRPRPVQRGNHVPPEPHRVVVGCVQRQPGHRAVARRDPVGQQGRLAGPGRGAHQDQPPRQPLIERPRQPRARHEPRPRARHVQLGRQQHIRPGIGNPSRSCRRAAQPSATHPSAQPSDSQPSPTGEPIIRPARLADRGRRVRGCHLQTAATGCLAPVAGRVRTRSRPGPVDSTRPAHRPGPVPAWTTRRPPDHEQATKLPAGQTT